MENITADQFELVMDFFNSVTDDGTDITDYKEAASKISDLIAYFMPLQLPAIAYNGGITPKAFWDWYHNLEKEYYKGNLIEEF